MFLAILTASLSLLMNVEAVASKKRLVLDDVDLEQELLLLKANFSLLQNNLKALEKSFQNNLTALEKENANLQSQLTVKAKGRR